MSLTVNLDSPFLTQTINTSNNQLNYIMNSFKSILSTSRYLDTFNQFVLTESDFKCILYKNLLPITNVRNCKIFTEVPDRPDRPEQLTRKEIVRTDITIGHDINLSEINSDIDKSFTLSGNFIDIEMKYIRNNNDVRGNNNAMKKDLDKLTRLINKNYVDGQGQTFFGLAIFGFRTEFIMNEHINDTDFRNRVNTFTTPRGRNNPCRKVLFVYGDNPTT